MTFATPSATDLPELPKQPTTRQLVQYAGAVGDYNEYHYDLRFVQALGLPDVLVHGSLQAAWLAQLAADWAGDAARVVSFDARYERSAFPGPYICRGRVVERDERGLVLELWGEDAHGGRCTSARAAIETHQPEESAI